MSVFISSRSAARRHGVYAMQRTPPRTVRPIGTGVAAIVGQFPWGPDQKIVTPSGTKQLLQTFAPEGMPRTGSGYLALIGKAFPTLKVVRIAGSGAAAASTALASANNNIVTIVAKYKGLTGNSLLVTVRDASNGALDHFDLDVSITGASGITVETYRNLNVSGVGPDEFPKLSDSLLIGSITIETPGRPANGTYTFVGGSDGIVSAGDYVGTPGASNRGIALLETDKAIRHVFTDDPGNSLRLAVNAGVRTHVNFMGDRLGYINGPPGQSLAEVAVDVSNYRSDRVVYVDPWVTLYDDAGAERLVAPASFAASVACQVSPSTSIAWKDSEVGAMLDGIVQLETDRGNGAADNTDNGVVTIIREEDGGYRFEAGILTIAPQDPSKRNIARTRMGDYIAVSYVKSSRGFVDSPSVPANWMLEVGMLQSFLESLKRAANSDPNHNPHVLDYMIEDLSAFNSDDDLANGDFTIPVSVKLSAAQERIFLSLSHGEGVPIRRAT